MNLYEIDFFEEIKTSANPYHLSISIYYADDTLREYIEQVCVEKQVCIYETYEPILKFLHQPSFVIVIDRLEVLRKIYKNMFNPQLVTFINLTIPMEFQFESLKDLARFKKLMTKQLQIFFAKELKKYHKIQKKIYAENRKSLNNSSSSL